MKAIMVMYDSLNRNMLEPYGCDWIKTPNFDRLAQKSVRFDQNYVGSMPCMPARRELHTGRYNFLHRDWSPIEPFDDSMPEILKYSGVHTHLVTDHQHYWEDGGATYHNRYSTYEFVRGQEGDAWKADLCREYSFETGFNGAMPKVSDPKMKHTFLGMKINDQVNRDYMNTQDSMSQAKTFEYGLEFLEKNHKADNWFLQIETFDPHEPFFTLEKFKKLFPHEYNGLIADWPPYAPCTEDEQTVNHVRFEYAALLCMCDHYLGKVLDFMDEHDMWKDTMLIVNTDHGYLLGEHGWWSKTVMPVYEEIAHTPLFIYDPKSKVQGESRQHLSQTIDLPVTLLSHFGVDVPKDMQGKDLRTVISEDVPVREYCLYGFHGMHVNITDGKHSYMKAPISYDNKPLYNYTLMPCHMRNMFSPNELQNIEIVDGFTFTKGCKLMKLDVLGAGLSNACNYGTKLYDLTVDPHETNEITDDVIEAKMLRALIEEMIKNDSPKEQFARLGITDDSSQIDEEYIKALRAKEIDSTSPSILCDYEWNKPSKNMFNAILTMLPPNTKDMFVNGFVKFISESAADKKINENLIFTFVSVAIPKEMQDMAKYFLSISARIN